MKEIIRAICYIIFLFLSIYEIDLWISITIIIIIELRNQRGNIRKLIRRIKDKDLFEGDDLIFKREILKINVYGEYGVGDSTLWAINNTKVEILAVDTSKQWVNKVKSRIKASDRLTIEWIDLGTIGNWGRPISYQKKKFIYNYIRSIWIKNEIPELVLIDGRFRVACFLFSLITGSPGTKIIFDDYMNRPHYHIVEEFIKPTETSQRQALFIVPNNCNTKNIQKTIDQFIYVMD